MKYFNMKAVIQITGINPNTLRAWERRYSVFKPERGKDGRRRYSEKDIEKMSLLWNLIAQGHLIGDLSRLSLSQLKNLQSIAPKASFMSLRSSQFATENEPNLISENQIAMTKMLQSINDFNLQTLNEVLKRAFLYLGTRAVLIDLILPLLKEVGSRVSDQRLTIAQEHLFSEMLRDHLGQIYQSLNPYHISEKSEDLGSKSSKKKQKKNIEIEKRILFTTREGDLHEFGVFIAAIIARMNGLTTFYLGPNLPADELVTATDAFDGTDIVLGLSQITRIKESVTVKKYLEDLDGRLDKKINLYLGGSADTDGVVFSQVRRVVRISQMQELEKIFMNQRN